MLLDYHAKNLLPSVWSGDGTLTMRFRAMLDDQMRRFPDAMEVLLVGDAVSHYWQDDSDVDIVIRAPEDCIEEYKLQTKRVSGYQLATTDNTVRFHIFPDRVVGAVLARYFGPIYSVDLGLWYGPHYTGDVELTRPESLTHRINWYLFKAKRSTELYPYEWRIVAEAFADLSDDERSQLIDDLRFVVKHLDANVNKLLRNQPQPVWVAAQKFEDELRENEELPSLKDLPRKVVYALLHKFRYDDLVDILMDIDDRTGG